VQRVTKGIGPEFKKIEFALARTFLPTLFGDDYDADDSHHKISCLPVKCAGLAIPDPTSLAASDNNTSILLCSHILAAFCGVDFGCSANHLAVITEVKAELKVCNQAKNESVMTSLTSKLSCDNWRTSL
jgi:hypothetical protein